MQWKNPSRVDTKRTNISSLLDAIALTPCYPAFLITADVPEVYMHQFWNSMYKHDTFYSSRLTKKKRFTFFGKLSHTGKVNSLNDVVVDQMHQPWRTFTDRINRSLSGKASGLDKLRLSRAQILWIYGAILLECLTSPTMKESKAYKTYIGYATGEVPPKISRKFKKASPTKKDSELVPIDEEPVTKGKRVKRSVKKSSTKLATGIVIREPPVETKSKGKEKEKVDVARGKGIELLSEVALTEKAQLKEVRKKSLRDFHKTHPSGSGTGAQKPPSVEKITPTVTSKGTGDKPRVPDVTEDDSTKSESDEEQESDSEQDKESDDDNQEKEEVDQENESEDDEIKSNEDKGIDDTTDQFDDDVDARLKEPTQTDKEVVQGEGADAEMIDAQQGNENLETTHTRFVEDLITEDGDKRGRKDKDKDEDPSAGSDRGLKKRKLSKDAEPTTGPKKKDSTSGSSKGTKSQPKSFRNTLIDFSSYVLNGLKIENLTQEVLLVPAFRLLKGTRSNYGELEYGFEECYKAFLEKLDWENLEGDDYPFDLSKPLLLIKVGNTSKEYHSNSSSTMNSSIYKENFD
ncbi:hypothetical protein Tco_0660783 [Tanacetum coccineum]